MLDPEVIYAGVRNCGVEFFTGVPDSLLKEFCACVTDLSGGNEHVIAANEGGSVAMATGHHFATGRCALVYMQNSGLGNAVNPLLSLADPSICAVPMLLMIGWRGEPGIKDEPQHIRQGEVTLPLLEAMGIPFFVLPSDESNSLKIINEAHDLAVSRSAPVAIVVKKGAFDLYEKGVARMKSCATMTRERALEIILDAADADSVFVSTTGKTSRELFELRENEKGCSHARDFLTVGSMGHSSQVALGLAMAKPDRRIVCLDGDGAMLMHMGGMAIIGQSGAENFLHIIMNNAAHESVGAQPTVAGALNIPLLGESLGYVSAVSCDDEEGLRRKVMDSMGKEGPQLIEVKISIGSRDDLGRPTEAPADNKRALMKFLDSNHITRKCP